MNNRQQNPDFRPPARNEANVRQHRGHSMPLYPDNIPIWQPEYKYTKTRFKECAIAGLSFHVEKDDELWDELETGTRVALVRHRSNKHDRNAVAVAIADDYDGNPDDFDFDCILGYIPRTDNAEIAALLDAGYSDKFSAEITTFKRYGSYNDRIRITISLESFVPMVVRPDLLRAESISVIELSDMTEELAERGTTCFRFGGYPRHELQYPVVGEKIVLVHRSNDYELLYLMRVLATGDDCAAYVDDDDLLNSCDDCAPFILTNIMGPVRIHKNQHEFLRGVNLKRLSATHYLHPRVSNGFNAIFNSILFRAINCNNIDMDPSIDEPNNRL